MRLTLITALLLSFISLNVPAAAANSQDECQIVHKGCDRRG